MYILYKLLIINFFSYFQLLFIDWWGAGSFVAFVQKYNFIKKSLCVKWLILLTSSADAILNY